MTPRDGRDRLEIALVLGHPRDRAVLVDGRFGDRHDVEHDGVPLARFHDLERIRPVPPMDGRREVLGRVARGGDPQLSRLGRAVLERREGLVGGADLELAAERTVPRRHGPAFIGVERSPGHARGSRMGTSDEQKNEHGAAVVPL